MISQSLNLYKINLSYSSVQADTALLEKQQAFDRSKIQERIVHPAGWAAFGEFVVTKDVTHLTKAKLFGSVGKKTPTFTRLSTVTYGREYPDSARNPRGHATKFYTEDGNYDLVGLNFPVFFVRDPFQGPDNIRSQQREPKSFLLNYNGWFDFLANVSLIRDIRPHSLYFARSSADQILYATLSRFLGPRVSARRSDVVLRPRHSGLASL